VAIWVQRRLDNPVDGSALELTGTLGELEHDRVQAIGRQHLAVDATHEHVRHVILDLAEPIQVEQVDEVAVVVDRRDHLVIRHLLEPESVENDEVVVDEVLHHRHVVEVLECIDLPSDQVDRQHEAGPVVADGVESSLVLTSDQLHRLGTNVDTDIEVEVADRRGTARRELLQRQSSSIVNELAVLDQVADLHRHDEGPLLIVGDRKLDDVDGIELAVGLRCIELGEEQDPLLDVERDPAQRTGIRHTVRQCQSEQIEVARIDIHRERREKRNSHEYSPLAQGLCKTYQAGRRQGYDVSFKAWTIHTFQDNAAKYAKK